MTYKTPAPDSQTKENGRRPVWGELSKMEKEAVLLCRQVCARMAINHAARQQAEMSAQASPERAIICYTAIVNSWRPK